MGSDPDMAQEQYDRIIEALEGARDELEQVANADVPFSSNAQAALDRLDEHEDETTDTQPKNTRSRTDQHTFEVLDHGEARFICTETGGNGPGHSITGTIARIVAGHSERLTHDVCRVTTTKTST